jgi:hypothetical protein
VRAKGLVALGIGLVLPATFLLPPHERPRLVACERRRPGPS